LHMELDTAFKEKAEALTQLKTSYEADIEALSAVCEETEKLIMQGKISSQLQPEIKALLEKFRFV